MTVPTKREYLSRRSFLKIMGIGAGTLALAACAAPAAAPAAEGGGEAAPAMASGTVEFLAWGDVADNPRMGGIGPELQDAEPGYGRGGDRGAGSQQQLLHQAADHDGRRHTAPCRFVPGLGMADLRRPRSAGADRRPMWRMPGWKGMYIDVPTVDISTVRNGSRYLIPLQVATMVMFYAKKPFDDAGIAYPTDDWTMEDMLSIAEQLTDTSGDSKMFGLQANGSWFRDIAYIRATGEQEFDELVDPKTAQFNQPGIVDMLQLVAQDVYYKLGIAPTPADMEGGANTIDTGNAAMKYEGAWYFGRLNSPELRDQGTQVEFDVVMMPQGADASRPHRGWAEGVALPKSDNEAGGWAFAVVHGRRRGRQDLLRDDGPHPQQPGSDRELLDPEHQGAVRGREWRGLPRRVPAPQRST